MCEAGEVREQKLKAVEYQAWPVHAQILQQVRDKLLSCIVECDAVTVRSEIREAYNALTQVQLDIMFVDQAKCDLVQFVPMKTQENS